MNIKETQIAKSSGMLHKVDIEMHSGRKFTYVISREIKYWLEEWVVAGPFDPVPAADCFLCFGALPERTIFVRTLDIRQVTVGPIRGGTASSLPFYGQAANRTGPPPRQELPSAVILLRQSNETIVFDCLDPDDNAIEINEINLWQPFFFKSGFMHFRQCGSSRFIPVTSISVLDLDRELVQPHDPWG